MTTSTRLLPAVAAACALAAGASAAGQAPPQAVKACAPPPLSQAYVQRVDAALRARRDVWGNELLASKAGPTYEGAARYLNPLLRAKAAQGKPLTESGAYYVAFSGQVGLDGSGSMALHVADGSQIVSQRAAGRTLSIRVGSAGRELFGSCLARLATPRLGSGYLPILETRYIDSRGVRYTQESFATRISATRSLVSFVRLTADARGADAGTATVRFTPSGPKLVADGNRLRRGEDTFLLLGGGGAFDGSSVAFELRAGEPRTVYVAWLNSPAPSDPLTLDEAAYEAAKRSLTRYWERRLAEGMTIDVPESRVRDAYRGLLVQNLGLAWRYSAGNPYQQFSYPEGVDVAQVLGAHGFRDVSRAILVRSLGQEPTRYPNWKIAQKLVGSALYYRLYRDRSYVERATPVLRGYVAELGRQIAASPRELLQRERFSSDIKDSVFGLHSQAVAWQGLRAIADVWQQTGRAELAATTRRHADGLERGLRAAVRDSQRRLGDGSLFVPARLLDGERPYGSVTEDRAGGYWNLVMPYALASGLFAPGSAEAEGALRYLLLHGSRMLGLVRAGAYSLYGLTPGFPASGVNPVYGLNAARFLADGDRPDQLVLSLYGQLAAGMAPGTFVSGEGLSVAPIGRERYRSMYLPPNAASNASFVETLRLLLVHEARDRRGRPVGLQLAFATPRSWLAPGTQIAVRNAPTSFGELSFSIRASDGSVRALIDVPRRARPRTLALRLRLSRGSRIAGVVLDGRPLRRFDARTGTIKLPTAGHRLELTVDVER
jgi:hypothetical protein